MGRAGSRQGHRRDLGGWPCAAQKQEAHSRAAPGPRASVPEGAARQESLFQVAATSAPRGDTGLVSPRSGQATQRHQGGAGRSGQGPTEPAAPRPAAPPAPRLPHLALLAAAAAAAASSGPAGSDAAAQAQTARGHVIAGERSAARSEAREVVPETRVGVGGREGLPGISEKERRRTRPGHSVPRPRAAREPQHTWRWFCTGLP